MENGYQESEILRQITKPEELQPLAEKKILVWHTRTEKSKNDNELKYEVKSILELKLIFVFLDLSKKVFPPACMEWNRK